jgi:DsbC/DsbD-like thiol-disulfide interchange protein
VRRTPHLAFSVALDPESLAPGTRTSVIVDVRPQPGMHVYAPGNSYRPLTIALESEPAIRIHDAVYPAPTAYLFKPLNERVLVYLSPFRVVRDVTVGHTAAQRAALRAGARVVIKGELQYQACDATVCYLPASVPFERTIRIIRPQ